MEHPVILFALVIQTLILSLIVGGTIFKVSFQPKQHIAVALLGGIGVYLIRNIFIVSGLPIGLSTLVNVVLTVLIFKYIFKLEQWKTPTLMSFTFYVIIIINEIITLGPIFKYLKTTPEGMLHNTKIHFETGMIQNLTLLVMMLLFYMIRKFIIDRRINKVCQ